MNEIDYERRGGLLLPVGLDAQETVPAAAVGRVTRWRRGRAERLAAGDTSRVQRFTNRSAEQRRLAKVTNPKVIQAESGVDTAAKLERIAADPRAEAYANRKIRKAALTMTGAGITLGVLISSSAAQATIAGFMGWAKDEPAYWAAYGADPALGLVLFAVLLVRAVATSRGVALGEITRGMFDRIEITLFALVALLNAGPSLGSLLIAAVRLVHEGFHIRDWSAVGAATMVLIIHTLGPVLVASGVFGLPYVASVLAAISAATTARQEVPGDHQEVADIDQLEASDGSPAEGSQGAAPAPINHGKRLAMDDLSDADQEVLADALRAIDEGRLDPEPGGNAIYRVVMGSRGDKGRGYRVAPHVAGYRPKIKAVS